MSRQFRDQNASVGKVEVVHWNPVRVLDNPKRPQDQPQPRSVNNFGDLLGPLIVAKMAGSAARRTTGIRHRLVAVGSIMHFAENGDTIWGSGVNGKIDQREYLFESLDVRAVRGPLSRDFLVARGIKVPEVYGDPALLLPQLFPILRRWSKRKAYDVTVVPNLNDWGGFAHDSRAWNPRMPLGATLKRIAQSRLVVGSSLHAVIVAESLGIPARAVVSRVESPFKYTDYFLGTSRTGVKLASDVDEALMLGGGPALDWTSGGLLRAAFPRDLWDENASDNRAGQP